MSRATPATFDAGPTRADRTPAEPAVRSGLHYVRGDGRSQRAVHRRRSRTEGAWAPPARRSRWQGRYQAAALLLDLSAAATAVLTAFSIRFDGRVEPAELVSTVLLISFPFAWIIFTGLSRAYETRILGAGATEFERLGKAFLLMTAVITFTAYASHADLSRGVVLFALPTTLVLSAGLRYALRKFVHRRRRAGGAMIPVLAVGAADSIAAFSDTLQRAAYNGLRVQAACLVGTGDDADTAGTLSPLAERAIPLCGTLDSIRDAVRQTGVSTVAVVDNSISGERLRWISWQLEGTDTELVVLPALTEVAGRRLSIQQVGTLPLLYVAEPEFTGLRRVVKSVFDRLTAALLLLALAPVLLTVALAVRFSSAGPAFFLQTRVGKNGKPFRMVKFRSMVADAEHQLASLKAYNEVEGGTLFKIKSDPRVTRVGRFLRRYSIDEVPQLVNVLTGSMSLVGPRPQLPSEVDQCGGDVRRRLLVKPGMTGLWQISGRSHLTWEESVRIDLRYVENWSLSLDLLVLVKTFGAVVKARGAY